MAHNFFDFFLKASTCVWLVDFINSQIHVKSLNFIRAASRFHQFTKYKITNFICANFTITQNC